MAIERTLSIIKPDAVAKNAIGEVLYKKVLTILTEDDNAGYNQVIKDFPISLPPERVAGKTVGMFLEGLDLEELIKLTTDATELNTRMVEAVEVPTEQVTEVRRGKKIKAERKFFPGYVLAKLNMNDDVYHLVKNTAKVTGFLGAGNKPQPISEKEASRYFGGVAEAQAAPTRDISVDYEIGDSVKVLDGPFASFNGIVEELDFDKAKVKVGVSIFGRATPVELDFEQVELAK